MLRCSFAPKLNNVKIGRAISRSRIVESVFWLLGRRREWGRVWRGDIALWGNCLAAASRAAKTGCFRANSCEALSALGVSGHKRVMSTKKQSKKDYHHGDLRAALVAKAREILEHDGMEKLSLRGVAKAAGVSPAAPYHHFADKTELLHAMAAVGFREFHAHMLALSEGAQSPRARLDLLGRAYVEYAVRHPALFRYMHSAPFTAEELSPELAEACGGAAEPLYRAVADCLPDARERDQRLACAAAWSMVHGLSTLYSDGRLSHLMGDIELDEAIDAVIAQLDLGRVLSAQSNKRDAEV